jgi:hypothetical protein
MDPIPSPEDASTTREPSGSAGLVSSSASAQQPATTQPGATQPGATQPALTARPTQPAAAPYALSPAPRAAPTPSPGAAPAAGGSNLRVDLFGVALAQTLPDGSAMGFSLEYEVAGSLQPSAVYAWVIEPPRGDAWRQQVALQASGNLITFVKEWPPTAGTYTTYIEEIDPSTGSRRIVSKRLPLTYAF